MAGEEVYVVGGANSAGQAALHLARFAAQVTLLVRGESLSTGMSDYLVTQLQATQNISVRLRTRVVDGRGEDRLETLTLEDVGTGQREEVAGTAVFVLIGAEPHTEWLHDVIQRDDPRVYPDRSRHSSAGLAVGASTAAIRDQYARRVRSGRCATWLGKTCRRGRWRGVGGGWLRPSVPSRNRCGRRSQEIGSAPSIHGPFGRPDAVPAPYWLGRGCRFHNGPLCYFVLHPHFAPETSSSTRIN